jgi:hypothetical protein
VERVQATRERAVLLGRGDVPRPGVLQARGQAVVMIAEQGDRIRNRLAIRDEGSIGRRLEPGDCRQAEGIDAGSQADRDRHVSGIPGRRGHQGTVTLAVPVDHAVRISPPELVRHQTRYQYVPEPTGSR